MRLLDLFCGAGGAAVGYHRAGFTEIVGVDNRPMPRYPFEFVQADALEYLREHGREFDVIHASPPCQRFSTAGFATPKRGAVNGVATNRSYPDLVTPTLAMLRQIGKPWIVENVPRAPVGFCVELCGLMFGLKVFRHRVFAASHLLLVPPHIPHGERRIGRNGYCCVAGDGDAGRWPEKKTPRDHRSKKAWELAMGIDWMSKAELSQAIPPAYCEWIGRRLLDSIGGS